MSETSAAGGRNVPKLAGDVCFQAMATSLADTRARSRPSVSYTNGSGVAKDIEAALMWWRKAAEQGHAVAQYNLGTVFYNGIDVARDYEEAARWFSKAASQGDADAQARLNSMRERELIRSQDTL